VTVCFVEHLTSNLTKGASDLTLLILKNSFLLVICILCFISLCKLLRCWLRQNETMTFVVMFDFILCPLSEIHYCQGSSDYYWSIQRRKETSKWKNLDTVGSCLGSQLDPVILDLARSGYTKSNALLIVTYKVHTVVLLTLISVIVSIWTKTYWQANWLQFSNRQNQWH